MNRTTVETFSQKQRRLLSYLGWKQGEALNDNVMGLLRWAFGTKGTFEKDGKTFCKMIPGKSVFQLHPRTIANWIMFYVDTKVKKEDLLSTRMEFSVIPMVEAIETNLKAADGKPMKIAVLKV